MLHKLVIIFLTVLATNAFPIGRIGNQRIGDLKEQYYTQVPLNFTTISEVQDGGVTLESGLFTSNPPLPVDIQVLPFRTQYSQLVNKGQKQIEEFFINTPGIHYRKLKVSNGALNLIGETDSSYVGTSVCGDGRGYVVFANKLDLTQKGIEEMIHKTIFESPCLK